MPTITYYALVSYYSHVGGQKMKKWQEYYNSHKISIEEAIKKIPSDTYVITSHCASEPRAILKSMVENKNLFKNINIFNLISMEEAPYCASDMIGHFKYNTIFVSTGSRKAFDESRANFIYSFYSELPSLIGDSIPVDVCILHVSPPDRHGYMSFGLTVDYQRKAANSANLVLAQVNDKMPRTLGDSMIHVSEVNYFCEVSQEIPELLPHIISDVERAIGENCASLVNDGDTLQLGIGAIPDAVLLFLRDKKDLGIHTEMFSDGVVDLIESGVITNKRKNFNPGVSVATFLMGSKRLYDYVDDNPSVLMQPVDYTNDARIIAKNDNLVAINSCIQVDFYGQVCSDMIGRRQFSGIGGQVDFVRGANMSRGGKAIIAMPSTAAKGTISRIVPQLDNGSAISTSRHDVDYIITEFGIAKLKGKSYKERAVALIDIAHPKFRSELEKQLISQL